jgi:glycosyltransferase involved in cell wall biosynthesis
MSVPTLLIIGPSPPPYNGMSVATELVVKAIDEGVAYIHLDTADRRGLSNVGKFELGNVFLAALHGTKYLWILLSRWPEAVYVPIAQAWLPFLRDCLFLIPAKLMRRKVIIHLHGSYFAKFYQETSPVMRCVIRFALRSVAFAIVLGRNVEGVFEGVIPAERIRVVPNGIPDSFKRGVQTARNDHPPTLLFLSTLMEEKGTLDLLRALPKVRERVGVFGVIFAGEWYSHGDKVAAEQLADRFELRPIVEFVGAVGPAKKQQLLENSDVLVFPTKYPFEGHPYVILEAMAAGLPILSTNWACIPEMVQDGLNGFLVAPGDVDRLAETLCLLLADAALRRRMGQASRERFLADFTFEKFSKRIRTVFEEVLEDGSQIRQSYGHEPAGNDDI